MSKEWPLDDVRNRRWLDIIEYLDELLLEINSESMSMLLVTVAFFENTTQIVDKLISAGANPSFNYPFDGVCDQGKVRFLDCEPGATPVGQTILGSSYELQETLPTLKSLIAHGADVNQITYSGYTPIQLAIVFDRPAHAELLLQSGADPWRPSADLDKPNAFDLSNDRSKDWAKALLNKYMNEQRRKLAKKEKGSDSN